MAAAVTEQAPALVKVAVTAVVTVVITAVVTEAVRATGGWRQGGVGGVNSHGDFSWQ